jgi:ATP-binding cassette, subfamily B, bacterial
MVFDYIWKISKKFKFGMSILIAEAIINALELPIHSLFLKKTINLMENKDYTNIWKPAIVLIVLPVVKTIAHRLHEFFVQVKMIPSMRTEIAKESMDKFLLKDVGFFNNTFAGSLASKLNDLVMNVPEIIRSFVGKVFERSLALCVAIVVLYYSSPIFCYITLVWCLFFLVICTIFKDKIKILAREFSEQGSKITGTMVDMFSNISAIKLFGKYAGESRNFELESKNVANTERKLETTYLYVWAFYGSSFCIMYAISIYYLVSMWKSQLITAGDFVLVIGIQYSIGHFLWEFLQQYTDLSRKIGRIHQAIISVDYAYKVHDKHDAQAINIKNSNIVFENVNFSYAQNDFFKDFNVSIHDGQKVGLVGSSGGGKTTFVNLILRFYDIKSGSIRIDNQQTNLCTQESLRSNIGMVVQDPSLFHRSIMDNIRYGKQDSTEDEVIEAAKKANAHDFIIKLPEGYNSLVGERGVKLSGGQRQRIAIARAILKNAPILILDEATSQLDSVTERLIQESLEILMHNKTTIVIAHRLSTLLNMDRILVFDNGKIVQDDSHANLIKVDGVYKKLWDSQVGGFLV